MRTGARQPGLYRGMDRAALDAAYNNQAAVADFPQRVARWHERSGAVQDASGATIDLRYGDQPRQTLDFFPARSPDAPLLFIIHGGYWQGGEKRSVGFMAEGPLARGYAVATVEYTVAPAARMSAMVEEIRSALSWLRERSASLGFDAARIVLAGHSAGAQLLCMVFDEAGVVGGIAISGVYDLEPVRLSYLNEKLALTPDDVSRYSPLQHLPARGKPLVVAVGAGELPEFVRQSEAFVHASGADYLPLAGHDHFSVIDELGEVNGRLCKELERFSRGEATA